MESDERVERFERFGEDKLRNIFLKSDRNFKIPHEYNGEIKGTLRFNFFISQRLC